jgi:saccharopine dehydrogenase (NAD+, L-lysine-forming)
MGIRLIVANQCCLVTPKTAKALIDAGYIVNVERSAGRIFDDEEFEGVGACLVAEGSWVEVPTDHIIVGLKELQDDDCKLIALSVASITNSFSAAC